MVNLFSLHDYSSRRASSLNLSQCPMFLIASDYLKTAIPSQLISEREAPISSSSTWFCEHRSGSRSAGRAFRCPSLHRLLHQPAPQAKRARPDAQFSSYDGATHGAREGS
ncbi:uncharacterized protein LOC120294676 [Eucalyptus grandis]|uniref:uncharacterized protein LOC120294676 n=1 Tax=Eucalyptus grandis TaxID=71139 RepID=UPI00192EED7B|nr:uncharacterized protein LOC120294676 [Eucalyptus grandis]